MINSSASDWVSTVSNLIACGQKVFKSWTVQELDFKHNILGGDLPENISVFVHECLENMERWNSPQVSCPDAKWTWPKTSDETKKQLSISINFRKHYCIETSQGAFIKEQPTII